MAGLIKTDMKFAVYIYNIDITFKYYFPFIKEYNITVL